MEIITLDLDKSKGFYYEQLYEYLKKEITENRMKKNEKLPSKRRLADHLNISQNTIETAYNQLIDEGYIYSKPRSGFYVSDISHLMKISKTPLKEKISPSFTQIFRYDFAFNGVDMDSNLNHYLAKCMKTLSTLLDDRTYHRSSEQGDLSLRQAISHYLYHSRGFLAKPENIYVSFSTNHLLQSILPRLHLPIFGVENPGYKGITTQLTKEKIPFYPIPLTKTGLILSSVPKEVNILSITPSHQFPTGCIYPIKERLQILQWASEKENRYILEDDYDSEFRYFGKIIPSLKSFDQDDRVIYIGNFSKSIASSFKTSYMVLPEKLLQEYAFHCPVSTITQQLIAQFITDGYFEKHLNYMRSIYKKKRDLLVKSLRKHRVKISGEDAGMHILCDFKQRTNRVLENAIRHRIKIYPIGHFYEGATSDRRFLMGYATIKYDDIAPAVDLLFQ